MGWYAGISGAQLVALLINGLSVANRGLTAGMCWGGGTGSV